jgi:hypothetical protein
MMYTLGATRLGGMVNFQRRAHHFGVSKRKSPALHLDHHQTSTFGVTPASSLTQVRPLRS